MTKIQYMSDLHLEFSSNSQKVHNKRFPVLGDILILAGDIMLLNDPKEWFLDWCSENFKETWWVVGNHEFYGGIDLKPFTETIFKKYRSNVALVNNIVIDRVHYSMIFSSGWSEIDPSHVVNINRGMNDYKVINYDNYAIDVNTMNRISKKSWDFIEDSVHKAIKPTVVCTHYAPSFSLIDPMFLNDPLNSAYCINKDRLLANNSLHFIHGHTHYNHKPMAIGDSMVYTNCLGYSQFENTNFDRKAYFEI